MPRVTAARSYPIDDRLLTGLDDAIAAGDERAEATARLALAIRDHQRFNTLAARMAGITFPPTPRGLARTSKTDLLGEPAPETPLAKARALAQVIAADLAPEGEQAEAAALALVLAEECRYPASKRRLHVAQAAAQPAT